MKKEVTPAKAPSRRLAWLPFLVSSLLMLYLCYEGGRIGDIGKPTLNLFSMPAGRFVLLYSATWMVSMVLLLVFPKGWSHTRSIGMIIVLAVLCRAFLFPLEPSDDINRYLWEGKLINQGISPYHVAPNHPSLSSLAKDDPFHSLINHPENPAAYPPFSLYLFAFIIRLSYTPSALKWVMILFDLGTLGFLLALLKHRGYASRWSILYSLNPVILYSFAGQGHFDSIQSFFLLGTIYFYDRKWWGWMYLFAGLAVQSKFIAIITIPFFLRRDNLKYLWIGMLTILIPYIHFIDTDWNGLYDCLIKFGHEYAFNGSIHSILREVIGGIPPATTISKYLLMAVLLFGYWHLHPAKNPQHKDDPVSGCFFALGALILISPTVHFWYLSWVIPFLAIRPTASWMILCLSISGYFVTYGILYQTGRWNIPAWAQLWEWVPFWSLFFYDIFLAWHRNRSPVDFKKPQTVSVIIPVMNEAKRIAICIRAVQKDPVVREVIVVDGGSDDNTVRIAKKEGARVILNPAELDRGGGRGGQIHNGLLSAKEDIVVVVHADIQVTIPVFQNIIRLLQKQPMIAGGAVGSVFSDSGWRFRMLEMANELRMVFGGISFGDQVQFFRRRPVIETSSFPNIPLMEDVEFSIRMKRLGRQAFLFGNARVSTRKWRKRGFGHVLTVIRFFTSYLWNRIWRVPDTSAMYRKYYAD